MKATLGLLGLGIAFCAQAETTTKPAADALATPFTITERGANHHVWARVINGTNKLWKVVAHTNSCTKLEKGMHRFENRKWKGSSAEIQISPTGVIAENTQHKAAFLGNINTAEAVKCGMELKKETAFCRRVFPKPQIANLTTRNSSRQALEHTAQIPQSPAQTSRITR